MSNKFIFQCENKDCRKVLLKENKNTKPGIRYLMAVDKESGLPVELPNVYCKHCGYLNIVTHENITPTENMTPVEKMSLAKEIKKEISQIEELKPTEETGVLLTEDIKIPEVEKSLPNIFKKRDKNLTRKI